MADAKRYRPARLRAVSAGGPGEVTLSAKKCGKWPIGARVYGGAAIALGLVGVAWGDFALVWQPVPEDIPGRTRLAYIVAATFVLAGTAIQWRKIAAAGAAVLTTLYSLCVVLLHVPLVIAHATQLSPWAGVAEQLALVAGGLITYASTAQLDRVQAERVFRAGKVIYGVCLFSFGLVHFVYLDATASFVPKWLPPGPVFWAYATGIGHWLAGLAILTGVCTLAAARSLTIMFVGFGVLVHAPALFSDPRSHMSWMANAMNLALIGSAWVLADSLEARRRKESACPATSSRN